ncbi:MAG: hypothetical protein JXA89_20990 [Anaerolineae bacterium]|nr:hypothetical protein [Anaerolineae bacterium]
MKRQIRIGLITLIVTLSRLALSLAARAAGEPRLRLSAGNLELAMGQTVTIDILVENAPSIYGIESHLAFDPTALQVVDADPDLDGVQLSPGDLIDAGQAFILQNRADNQAGTVDYALTLVNPAPAVQGDGVLAQITFEAKAPGQTTIWITKGLFGTRSGETVAPLAEHVEMQVIPVGQRAISGEDQRPSHEATWIDFECANSGAVVGRSNVTETQVPRSFSTMLAVEFVLVIVLLALGCVRLAREWRRSVRA